MSLTYTQLTTRMKEVPLKARNIGQFCGYLIYDGKCGQKNCPRMHTLNLDYIRLYLDDDKVKSVLCEKGAHCTHFVCRFGHDYDHDILGHTDPENPEATIFENDEQYREDARRFWREAKQQAYNSELLNGDRKPKNKRDRQLLERLRKDLVSVNKDNFPNLPGSAPVAPPSKISWADMDDTDDTNLPNLSLPALAVTPLCRSNAGGNSKMEATQTESDDIQADVAMNQINQINFHYNGICQHFDKYPGYLQDPVVSQLFQVAFSQNQLLNM